MRGGPTTALALAASRGLQARQSGSRTTSARRSGSHRTTSISRRVSGPAGGSPRRIPRGPAQGPQRACNGGLVAPSIPHTMARSCPFARDGACNGLRIRAFLLTGVAVRWTGLRLIRGPSLDHAAGDPTARVPPRQSGGIGPASRVAGRDVGVVVRVCMNDHGPAKDVGHAISVAHEACLTRAVR